MAPLGPATELARAQAARLLDDGAADEAVPDTLALAWALKEQCYASWGAQPARAVRAARLLAALPEAGLDPQAQQQLRGLAAWTGGIAHLTQGQMAQAVQAFDSAEEALRLAGLPDPAAQTQVPKIMALSMLGRHDEATRCAQHTQRSLLALGNVAAAARVSQNLGGALLLHDAYAEAARHFREAAVLFARLGDHEHSVLADLGLCDALAAQGDVDEALRIGARAQMRAANQGLQRQLALADESLALLHQVCGRWREALSGMESARRRFQALGLAQAQATAERQLADAYLELHLLPEALALLDEAVALFAARQLPVEQAWALAQRGRAQALLGHAAAADASFAEAAHLFAAQGTAVGAATVSQARAELALRSGDSAAALQAAEHALQDFSAAGRADGAARAQVLRAQALLAAGRLAEARQAFAATLQQARQRGQLQIQVRCLSGQGQCLLVEGQPDAARQAFEAAIELFEDQRRALPGDDIRSAFLHDHLLPYEACLRLALQAGDGAQVLWQLDRVRARALELRLAEGGQAAGAAGDEATQALRERLNWLVRRVRRLQDEGESSQAFDEELRQAEQALLEQARRQRLAAAGASPAGPEAGGLQVPALLQALGPQDALVAWGVLDDTLFACVATGAGVHLVRELAPWPAVLQACQALRFQIDTLRQGAAHLGRHLPELTRRCSLRLRQVHALVWAPLQAVLPAGHRVLLVPHGALGGLPFAALEDVDGEPLAERHVLAQVASASAAWRVLRGAAVPAPPPTPLRHALALGESTRLPHAAEEARFVAALFPEGQAFTGEQAATPQLRAHAGRAQVLHLACHAEFRGDNPRFSALHLHDAPLTVDDAETLGLPGSVVVLSACETGAAEVASGDEMVGLVRGFLVGGASRVLASLWPVDDAVTRRFMASFYQGLAEGLGTAAALQAAQRQMRAMQPHPAFWAPFTVHGGW